MVMQRLKKIKLAPTVVKGAQFNQNFCTEILLSYGVKCDIGPLPSGLGVIDPIRPDAVDDTRTR